ncbi:MAG: TetR/AcrR family transcriptional regulator [Butyrivibrio sp.]|nr:TetR/AcrR family transcriptional regulator [Butyrivibrio sp.]
MVGSAMGAKASRTEKHILAKAREIFSKKGFKNVTMQDIVDACDISRGGLYLHFSSVEDIFLAVLKAEEEVSLDEETLSLEGTDDGSEASQGIEVMAEVSASDRLAAFLKEQKRYILRRKDGLSLALMEYYSGHNASLDNNYIKIHFDNCINTIEMIISDGVESGEFECEDITGFARNLAYVLEGLKTMATVVSISEQAVDKEMFYILQGIVPADQYTN